MLVKEEQIKKYNKASALQDAKHQARVVEIEEKLLLQSREVNMLKKFKNDLEKNLYSNP